MPMADSFQKKKAASNLDAAFFLLDQTVVNKL